MPQICEPKYDTLHSWGDNYLQTASRIITHIKNLIVLYK